MSNIRLRFPALVKKDKHSFTVQPLLFPGDSVTSRRYSKAIQKFKDSLEKLSFSGRDKQQQLTRLLWYTFNPNLKLENRSLEIRTGRDFIKGHFTTVTYRWRGFIYMTLPLLDYTTILIGSEKEKIVDDFNLVDIIQNFFRSKKKNVDEYLDQKAYLSSAGDFYTEIDHSILLNEDWVNIQVEQDNFFAIKKNFSTFDGKFEIKKVGREWKEPKNYYNFESFNNKVKEVENVFHKEKAPCIVIVGPNGSGKSSILQKAIESYNTSILSNFTGSKRNLFSQFITKNWYIDPLRVISGMSIIGEWERRFESILKYAKDRQLEQLANDKFLFKTIRNNPELKEISHKILSADRIYIRNLVSLFRIGKTSQSNLTLSDVLKPYLENREIGFIGEATQEEWAKVMEIDQRFADLFTIIRVEHPSVSESLRTIMFKRLELEREKNVTFALEAMDYFFTLLFRYSPSNSYLGKGISLLEQISTRYIHITVHSIQESFKNLYHFREIISNNEIPLQHKDIIHFLDHKIIGQQSAKESIANTIHTVKSNLNEEGKPFASLLFIGPTGVGKTESAKAIAEFLFGSPDSLIRFNMNEYVDYDAVSRLIGDISHPEGQLTSRVRHEKACIVLLDEIEKAHPSIHDLLLQVLGEGRLTDVSGITTDFSNTIIIMTSNLGAEDTGRVVGFQDPNIEHSSIYKKAVEDFFRPEFLNRIDEIVIFHRLTKEELHLISKNKIQSILNREGLVRRLSILNIEESVVEKVALADLELEMGARGLNRNIEKSITYFAANQLVKLNIEQPIIINLILEDNELIPEIIPLYYIKENKSAIDILKTIQNISIQECEKRHRYLTEQEKLILEILDKKFGEEKYLYWTLLDQVRELKTTFENLYEELENKLSVNSITHVFSGFNFKPVQVVGYWGNKDHGNAKASHTDFNRILSAYDEIDSFLKEVLKNSSLMFEQKQSKLVSLFLDSEYLGYIIQEIEKSTSDKICLHIETYMEGIKTQQEVNFIAEQYRTLFKEIGIFEEHKLGTNHISMIVTGHGLNKLLKGEMGFHFFYRTNQSIIPIYVSIKELDPKTNNQQWIQEYFKTKVPVWKEKPVTDVIRLYTLKTANNPSTITDIRTGLIAGEKITPNDWKMILYHNLIEGKSHE